MGARNGAGADWLTRLKRNGRPPAASLAQQGSRAAEGGGIHSQD